LDWVGEARVQLSHAAGSFHEKSTYMLGSQELIKKGTRLKAGLHEYLFSIPLPTGIPSTFKSFHPVATIAYKVSATLKSGTALFDKKIEREFIVKGHNDLNDHPECLLPEETSRDCNVCCYCCASKPIGYAVKLERTGFLAEDCINFVAELFNRSRRNVHVELKFFLLERRVFWSQGKSEKVDDRIVTELPGPKLDNKNREIVQSFSLSIPPLNCNDQTATTYVYPTNLGGGRLVNITYYFKVQMKVPCHDVICSEIRIRIGTVPFHITAAGAKSVAGAKIIAAGGATVMHTKMEKKSAKLSANSFNY